MALSTNDVSGVETASFFEVTCTAVTCSDRPDACVPKGQMTTCNDLQLLRQPLDGGNAVAILSQGQLTDTWTGLLQDLKVVSSQDNKLVLRIPKSEYLAFQHPFAAALRLCNLCPKQKQFYGKTHRSRDRHPPIPNANSTPGKDAKTLCWNFDYQSFGIALTKLVRTLPKNWGTHFQIFEII